MKNLKYADQRDLYWSKNDRSRKYLDARFVLKLCGGKKDCIADLGKEQFAKTKIMKNLKYVDQRDLYWSKNDRSLKYLDARFVLKLCGGKKDCIADLGKEQFAK